MSYWVEPLEGGTRCKKWKARAQVGSRSTKRRHSVTIYGTKREAISAARELEREIKDSPKAEKPGTFESFAAEWNDARLSSGAISENTYEQYAHLFAGLSLHIGKKKMDELSPSDIECALAALRDGDTPSGKPWGGTTLRAAFKACKKLCGEAVTRGMAKANPAASVTPPKKDTKPRKALTLEDSARLLSVLSVDDAHEFACSLMLRTGMRAGECLGVRWSDVGEGFIRIPREATKTDAGARIVPIDTDTAEYIKRRLESISGFLAQFGHEVDASTPLCCTKDGRSLTYDALKHWWTRHAADFGLEGWTMHELRHTFATNLAQADVHPAVMSKILGHTSSEITMEIYTHVHSQDMKDAVDALNSARNVPQNVPPDGEAKESRSDVLAI